MVTLFRYHFHIASLLQALFEGCLVFSVVYLVVANHPGGAYPGTWAALSPAFLFTTLMIGANAAFGLYRHDQPASVSAMVPRLACAVLIALVLGYALFHFFPDPARLDGALSAGAITAIAGALIGRTTVLPGLASGIAQHRILVLGMGKRAAQVEEAVGPDGTKGMSIVGFVTPKSHEDRAIQSSRVFGAERPLLEIVQQLGIHEIIVAVQEQRGGALPIDDLLVARLDGVKVTEVADFLERVRGAVALGSFKASWLVYGEGFSQGRIRTIVKRLFDIFVSASMLALVAPVMLLTALAIRLESKGGVVYRQQRVGRAGDCFDVLKFRSMCQDAESDGKPRWAAAGDARVTRIGRFIRRTRIDELPQLLNVLKGEMSFVGPRPERPFFVEQLQRDIPFYSLRHSVKPGITGWAQVRYAYGATVEDAAKKLEYDLYYVKNHTLFLDLMILLETVRVVVFGEGVR